MNTSLERIAEALGRLFSAFPQSAHDPDTMLRVYAMELVFYNMEIVEKACRNFMTGNALGYTTGFVPALPTLLREVRRLKMAGDPADHQARGEFHAQLEERIRRGSDEEFELYSTRVISAKPYEDISGLVQIADAIKFHVALPVRVLVEGDVALKRIAAE